MSRGAPTASDPGEWRRLPIEVPAPGSTEACELEGVPLLVCNVEGRTYVLRNECPHVQVPLTGARLRGTVLECPLHGGELDIRDGAAVALPIRKSAGCFEVRQRDAAGEGPVVEVRIPARDAGTS